MRAMHSDHCGQRARGLTLIELLAVVVILSLTASLGVVGLSSIDANVSLERLGSEWREMDARARFLARRPDSGAVIMAIRDERLTLTLANAPDLNALIVPPRHVLALMIVEGDPDESNIVHFDGRGCTPDYLFEARSGDRVTRWTVSGETGWINFMSREREGVMLP